LKKSEGLLSFKDALSKVIEVGQGRGLESETVALRSALGRWTSEDVLSAAETPSFNNSAMDGFAVISESTVSASQRKAVNA